MTGLSASGATTVIPKTAQCTAPAPLITTAAPRIAPVIACVVETGNPVRDANITQPNTPADTARKNRSKSAGAVRSSPVLKVFKRPADTTLAASAPATVQI